MQINVGSHFSLTRKKESSQHGIKLITWSFHEKGLERVILKVYSLRFKILLDQSVIK